MRSFVWSLILAAAVMPFLAGSIFAASAPASCAPPWEGNKCPTGCTCLENPLNPYGTAKEQPDIPIIIGYVIKSVLGVVGGLALLMFVWGGFNWLISAGNAERVKKGTQAMIWAGIGLVITLSSYIIVLEVFKRIAK